MELSLGPAARAALAERGWSSERRVDIADHASRLSRLGYRLDDRTIEVLASLVGLRVGPVVVRGVDFQNDEPFIVDPLGVGTRNRDECRRLERMFGTTFSPLGWWLCRSHVYFGASGLVVAALPGVIWHLGDTLDEAIEFMLSANRPLVRLLSMDDLE
ncbi:SUKH-3 domain-containing protein [Micromonospora sp. CPCC 205556]|uniref:SUKH-3 domain-containing protein n=1 Tax=Micromonospora sp. CPCC 205556 TaxID=3122398 RepID=UPI002FF2EA8C